MNLNQMKEQNTWRNVYRFALPAALVSSTGSPRAGAAETFTTRTMWTWLVSKQQKCPAGNQLRKTVGVWDPVSRRGTTQHCKPQRKALSGASCKSPFSMCDAPIEQVQPPTAARKTPTGASPITRGENKACKEQVLIREN
jgi:hypothetical protein